MLSSALSSIQTLNLKKGFEARIDDSLHPTHLLQIRTPEGFPVTSLFF